MYIYIYVYVCFWFLYIYIYTCISSRLYRFRFSDLLILDVAGNIYIQIWKYALYRTNPLVDPSPCISKSPCQPMTSFPGHPLAGVQASWSGTSGAVCFFIFSRVPRKVFIQCSKGYSAEGHQEWSWSGSFLPFWFTIFIQPPKENKSTLAKTNLGSCLGRGLFLM